MKFCSTIFRVIVSAHTRNYFFIFTIISYFIYFFTCAFVPMSSTAPVLVVPLLPPNPWGLPE